MLTYLSSPRPPSIPGWHACRGAGQGGVGEAGGWTGDPSCQCPSLEAP